MKKIKLFGGSMPYPELEKKVNDWIEKELIEVIDFKLSESMAEQGYCTTILVIYKDSDNGRVD